MTVRSARTHIDHHESATEAITCAVADCLQTEVTELPSLYDYIDPGAVNQLCDTSSAKHTAGSARLNLTYADCQVTIHLDGQLYVCTLGSTQSESTSGGSVGQQERAAELE